MMTHPSRAVDPLVEPADLDRSPLPERVREHERALRTTLGWARTYLCRPHADLGRKGPVCPYAESSLVKGTFYLAVHAERHADPGLLAGLLVVYRDWFTDLEPRTGPAAQFKAILVLLPGLDHPPGWAIIDATQRALKSQYVARGLMVGEFHNGPPDKAGLWNADFRPLRSPVPLLAVRHMVATDFPFLRDDERQVAAYLRLFGDHIPPHLLDMVTQARSAGRRHE